MALAAPSPRTFISFFVKQRGRSHYSARISHTTHTHTHKHTGALCCRSQQIVLRIYLLVIVVIAVCCWFIYLCLQYKISYAFTLFSLLFYSRRAATPTQLNPAQLSSPPKNIPLMWKLCAARPALPCLMIVATTFIHQSITVIAICCYCCCLLTCCLHSTLICCRRMLSYVPSALVCVASLTQCQFRQRHHVSLTT